VKVFFDSTVNIDVQVLGELTDDGVPRILRVYAIIGKREIMENIKDGDNSQKVDITSALQSIEKDIICDEIEKEIGQEIEIRAYHGRRGDEYEPEY